MKLAAMAFAVGISLAGPAHAQIGAPQTLADLIALDPDAAGKVPIDFSPPTPTPNPTPGTTPPPRVTPSPTPGPGTCTGVFCPKGKLGFDVIKPPTLEQMGDMSVINPGRPRDY